MASDPSTVQVGDRLSYDGAPCTVRYVGAVKGTSGSWLGVEWDDPARGKHDGSHKGDRYFTCISQSPTAASFVRPTRPAEPARGFLGALVDKYTAELVDTAVIKFSGKVAEEVGFAKTRRKQANLVELRVAILDGERIVSAYDSEQDHDSIAASDNDGGPTKVLSPPSSIAQTCPKVRDLDLSRNLFRQVGSVVEICSELPALRSLRLNGNRFEAVLDDATLQQNSCRDALRGLEEVTLEETLLTWDEICHICSRCEGLLSLSASMNQLTRLPPAPSSLLSSSLTSTLVVLNLEFNDFTSLADIASLGSLEALRNLNLKGNNIETLMLKEYEGTGVEEEPQEGGELASLNPTQYPVRLPIFSASIQYLDISYNQVNSWDFVDGLPTCFPGLTALRFAHNPIYDNPELEQPVSSSTTTTTGATAAKNMTEEAYMFTVARLANLKALNFGTISKEDRQDAEMFYLGRIGKQLATSISAPPPRALPSASIGSEAKQEQQDMEREIDAEVQEQESAFVRRHHPRYAALCELYGAPAVVRRKEVNPAFIEARLITVHLSFPCASSLSSVGQLPGGEGSNERTVQLPRGLDVYAVKGIVAKIFGGNAATSTASETTRGRMTVQPLDLRLVWETGEWDPVADFDQEDVDDSGDDDDDHVDPGPEKRELGESASPRASEHVVAAASEPHPPTAGPPADIAETAAVEGAVGRAGGKWIKREVELPDGPRQLGFCVDGQEVRIRVELRN